MVWFMQKKIQRQALEEAEPDVGEAVEAGNAGEGVEVGDRFGGEVD